MEHNLHRLKDVQTFEAYLLNIRSYSIPRTQSPVVTSHWDLEMEIIHTFFPQHTLHSRAVITVFTTWQQKHKFECPLQRNVLHVALLPSVFIKFRILHGVSPSSLGQLGRYSD